MDKSLTMMCKVHQKALSAAMALEGEIERLSQMRTCPQSGVRLRSQDHHRSKGEGQKKICGQVSFADELAPGQSANPDMPSGGEGSEGRDYDLGEPLELKPAVASFLQGSPETSDDEGDKMPPEPAILDFAEWVHGRWKGVTLPAGGWNYQQFQEKIIPGSLPGRLEQPLGCNGTYRNWMQEGPLFRLPLLCHAFVSKVLCHHLTQFLPVGT